MNYSVLGKNFSELVQNTKSDVNGVWNDFRVIITKHQGNGNNCSCYISVGK